MIRLKNHHAVAKALVEIPLKCNLPCVKSSEKDLEDLKGFSCTKGSTHAGASPVEPFSKAPITRNGVSARVKGVSNTSGSLIQGYGFVHSTGQSFPIRNNNEVTMVYVPIRHSQTSLEYGNKKDSKPGGAVVGCM